MRYASLHRAVERGMASEEVLRELVDICLQLGHTDEAKRVYATMRPGAGRDLATAKLVRRGLLNGAAPKGKAKRVGHRVGHRGPRGSHAAGPAGHAGHVEEPTIREHVLDAFQFLFQAHMPIVALVTMLAFPLVVGVGGFLTAGGSLWLFAGLAAIPGLCVLGTVGAMGRTIFLEAADGSGEIPPIPAPAAMVGLARRHLGDTLLVLGALVAPSLTLVWFEAPLVSSLPGLVLGMFLTPIALILRMTRGDLGALSPVALIRGIGCCRGYTRIAGAYWLAFAPAAVAFWLTLGHAIWLQIAIIGPLAVLPTFATMRLLGTFTEVHRDRLGLLLHPARADNANARPRVAAAAPARADEARRALPPIAAARLASAPNLPPRPSNIVKKAQHTTPQPSPLHQRKPARPAPAPSRVPPAARRIEGRAPVARANEPQVRKPSPARPLPPSLMPLEPNPIQFDGPDLSNIPGARVITGEDRERFGASSSQKK
jgi:hypothetical protein